MRRRASARAWTDEDDWEFIVLWVERKPIAEIAAHFATTEDEISVRAIELQLSARLPRR